MFRVPIPSEKNRNVGIIPVLGHTNGFLGLLKFACVIIAFLENYFLGDFDFQVFKFLSHQTHLSPHFRFFYGAKILLEIDSAMMKRKLGRVKSKVVTGLLGHAW